MRLLPARLARPVLACLIVGLAAAAGADTAAPDCSVAREPQVVTPAGILHVLDAGSSQILRWSLLSSSARPPLPIESGAAALAYLPRVDSLVIAYADPPALTLRPLPDDANEVPFAADALAGVDSLCGMVATDQQVVVCVDHNHYLVLDAAGETLSESDVGAVVEPNDPNDPNAPIQPSWDDMAWDGASRTLFSVRNQGKLLGGFKLHIDDAGGLGEADFADPNALLVIDPNDPNGPDPNAPRTAQLLTLMPGGGRLIAPDGLELTTNPFEIVALPQLATGALFALGDRVLTLGAANPHGCGLSSPDLGLTQGALVSTGPIRSAERKGRTWILRGAGADVTVSEVFPDTGDLDRDRAPDSWDFFPLEPETGRDWDHDGVPDPNDAFPTTRQGNSNGNPNDWLDTDGDKVGDNADAFPDDPNEQADRDGDGVGDHADACPDDPTETVNSDGDTDDEGNPVCDGVDAFPIDPLEQTDDGDDGVGDHAEAQDTTLGTPIAAYQVTVKRDARLSGFSHEVTSDSELLILFDNDRFELCAPADCETGAALTGSVLKRNRSGNKLTLDFDIAVMSQLEPVFAQAGAELVAADTADPPSPTLTFYPNRVTSKGTAALGKKGVTLSLQLDLRYARGARGARGPRGLLVYRAKGPPALPTP